MRFFLAITVCAFTLGISAGALTQHAVAPMVNASPMEDKLDDLAEQIDSPTIGVGDIRELIVRIINFILSFLALVAVIMIIIAGFFLILGGGSENSAQRAKKIIIYTIIGLIIIFFARVIVGFFTEELPSFFP